MGSWVAIVFAAEKKIVLSGTIADTTHHRMELTAVIEAIKYARLYYPAASEINIVSDSQYVTGLEGRSAKLSAAGFRTKAGNDIQNADLVKEFLGLFEHHAFTLKKIKAHQAKNNETEHNIEADRLSRQLLRSTLNRS
jgi:ribonuclease HI